MGEKYEIKNENIKKFLEKMAKDEALQTQMTKAENPEAAYKIASGVQDGFTEEEFIDEMKRLYAAATADLSEDDVAKIAGGKMTDGTGGMISAIISGSVSAGGAFGIALGVAACH